MAFDNVNMSLIDDAHRAWKKADEIASGAESVIRWLESKEPPFALGVLIKTSLSFPPGGAYALAERDFAQVAAAVDEVLSADLATTIRSATVVARANADRLRDRFLRLAASSVMMAGESMVITEASSDGR